MDLPTFPDLVILPPSPSSTSTTTTSTSTSPPPPLASTQSSTTPPSRPRRKPIPCKGHTKSRRGCYACKRRRVKCQETLPTCANCRRVGLTCEYPTNPTLDTPSSRPYDASGPATETVTSNRAVSRLCTPDFPDVRLRHSPAQLSMLDLRFFQHFLFHAYPGLPIAGVAVWHSIAQLAHSFDFLGHAILALGASHLSLLTDKSYTEAAFAHRTKAIAATNAALSRPCTTREEGDARYAALMALTFQSSYMPDGMCEFLTTMRGTALVASKIIPDFTRSLFSTITSDHHKRLVFEWDQHRSAGYADKALVDRGLISLAAMAPLCKTALEDQFFNALYTALSLSARSYAEGFAETCKCYDYFATSAANDFDLFTKPTNPASQILLAHFCVIERMLDGVSIDATSLTLRFRKGIVLAWVDQIKNNLPQSYAKYLEWPIWFMAHEDKKPDAYTRIDPLSPNTIYAW